ncbi:hypothetical protein GCM10010425_75680 [Streptomyces spororaveus]|uniref:Uncharacterized protein n=1 Tax=Streptomyces spororaveus TaxID=284039 RepID=A0ABQ3T3M4_9ACTN|nr:hypothetical protein [Streptomyces spororaveus]MCM9077148.1 hypothetical protein [Streptomyces spororaveus]GHI74990.1 hypothetical protein Sspor_05510 [Streptomyces spororaveus]GHI75021.1 hypothetical protein Sspor_05820 [Streptomyces spororaveus]
MPSTPRTYTAISTLGADGRPAHFITAQPVGAVVIQQFGTRPERFLLTDVQLADGSFVAEPLDRYL